MTVIDIPYNTDHTLKFRLSVDDADPFDLSAVLDIEVIVYQKKSDVLASFKLSDSEVVVTNAVSGECECYLQRSSITSVKSGRLFCQISIDSYDENFEDNTRRDTRTDILMGQIVNIA